MDDKIEESVENEPKMKNLNQSRNFLRGFLLGLGVALLILLGTVLAKQVIKIQSMVAFSTQQGKEIATEAELKDSGKKKKIATLETLQKVDLLQETINEFYLDKSDIAKLEEGIYHGVIDALEDPYSTYYSAEELVEIQNQTQGIYYGVGAYIGMDETTQLPGLSKIIENTPAKAAGLLEGDIIVKVGDIYTKGMEVSDVVAKIKGEEGTKVRLTIYREGNSDYLEFDVERRKIESPTVTYKMLEDKIAYIEIREFDEVTIDQFKEAYVMAQGNEMKGLIIDLRSNPGGNLSAVTEISRMILPKGLIVYTEDKNGERMEYTCDGTQQIKVPLSVLINGNSASASEILAGAVKDYGIGTLVGTTTYGKGIVQRIISLSDGSAVKLTVSKYYTPKGNNIHKIGVAPDAEVEFDGETYLKDGTDNQLQKAIEVLKEKEE